MSLTANLVKHFIYVSLGDISISSCLNVTVCNCKMEQLLMCTMLSPVGYFWHKMAAVLTRLTSQKVASTY